MYEQPPKPRMAIDCQWLRRSLGPSHMDPFADPLTMACTHIIRAGERCVGPFLEDMETSCRLWDRIAPRADRGGG